MVFMYIQSGQLAHLLKEYRRANGYADEGLGIARSVGHRFGKMRSLISLGKASHELKDHHRAGQELSDALELGLHMGVIDDILKILIDAAVLWMKVGRVERAIELLTFVLHHPAWTAYLTPQFYAK